MSDVRTATALAEFLEAHPECEECGAPSTDVAVIPVDQPEAGDRQWRAAALCRRHAERRTEL